MNDAEIQELKINQEALLGQLRDALCVAVTMLFDTHREDTVAEFSIEELRVISEQSMNLGDQRVEDVYRRGFQALDQLMQSVPAPAGFRSIKDD